MAKSLKSTALPFSKIPTLKQYPIIGHSYLFLPGGKYSSEKLTEAVADISKLLGGIFKLRLGMSDIVFTTDADYTEKLIRNEGTRPIRPTFPALYKYRKQTFDSIGVVPGNGEEWYKLRSGVLPLLKPPILAKYKRKQKIVADNFVTYIEHNRDSNNYLNDIWNHLIKFAIEITSLVCPGHKFHCLIDKNVESEIITKASNDFMDGMYKTFIGPPLWKIYRTAAYKQLESSHQTIYDIIKDNLQDIHTQFVKDPNYVASEHPFMHTLFSNHKLSESDKVMIAMEIFLGGIDTTATTTALTLNYLARNKHVQSKARADAETEDNTYLNACVKETLRMSPTAGAIGRIISHDVVMGGYEIPKNTLILAFTSVTSNKEEYFKNAYEYKPERWIRDIREEYHKFASLPFGHGPRMCPGKRLAENEIVMILKQILRKFQLDVHDNNDVEMVFRMNRIPSRPINIQFNDLFRKL